MTAETIHQVAAPPVAPRNRQLRTAGPPSYEPLAICGCEHEQDTHEHHRAGTDCGICGPVRCKRFRRRTGRGARSSFRRAAR